jgi:hypothetical protein
LLNIISGLLISVVTELAVFLRGDTAGGDVAAASLSFEVFLDSQENALVSFLEGGGGGGDARPFLEGTSAVGGGDQGMAGKAFVRLLSEIFFGGWCPAALFSSFGVPVPSSSRLTLSKDATETCEIRGEDDSTATPFGLSSSAVSLGLWSRLSSIWSFVACRESDVFRLVRDRTEPVSGASSKVSCIASPVSATKFNR